MILGAWSPVRGGICDYGVRLAHGLARCGDVNVWATVGDPDSSGPNLVVRQGPLDGLRDSLRLALGVRRSGAHILIVQEDAEGRYWKGGIFLAAVFARFLGVRLILVVHEAGSRRQFALSWISAATVLVDELWCQRSWFNLKKCRVIHIPPNIPRTSEFTGPRTGAIRVGTFGFFSARKQPLRLALALGELCAQGHPVEFTYIGEVPNSELGQEFRGILERAKGLQWTIAGYTAPERVAELLESSTVNVLLFSEPVRPRYGSYLAALQQSAPIVTTGPNFEPQSSVVEVSADISSVREVAEAIIRAADMPRLHRRVASWDEVILEYEEVIHGVMGLR